MMSATVSLRVGLLALLLSWSGAVVNETAWPSATVCDGWPGCLTEWIKNYESTLTGTLSSQKVEDFHLQASQNNCSAGPKPCTIDERVKELDDQLEHGEKLVEELEKEEKAKGAKVDGFWDDWLKRASFRIHESLQLKEELFQTDVQKAEAWLLSMEEDSAQEKQLKTYEVAGDAEEPEEAIGFEEQREKDMAAAWQHHRSEEPNPDTSAGLGRRVHGLQRCLMDELMEWNLREGDVQHSLCPPTSSPSDCYERCKKYCKFMPQPCRAFYASGHDCWTSQHAQKSTLMSRLPNAVGAVLPPRKIIKRVMADGAAGAGGLKFMEAGDEPHAVHSVGHKLCAIVPYRDGCSKSNQGIGRVENLKEMVNHMPAFLKRRGVPDFRLIIVEQTKRGLFNKGVMFNSGAKYAESIGCDYLVMNDVDQLPIGKELKHEWPEKPIHLCTATDMAKFKFYETMVGGALMLQVAHYKQLNGYSNKYFGWGQEDDDMFERIKHTWKKVTHFDKKKGKYHALEHGRVKDLDVTEDFKKNSEVLKKTRKEGKKVFDEDGYNKIDQWGKVVKSVKGPMKEEVADMDIVLNGEYDHLLIDVLDENGKELQLCEAEKHSAGHKLCMVVPYRDGCSVLSQGDGRKKNLEEFLAAVPGFLDARGVPEFEIVVVEQSKKGRFNKGVLFNVGVKHGETLGCDYLVMNDVDHIPVGPDLKHEWPDVPTHLCTATDMKGFKLYDTMVGGALLLQLDHYKKLNGYSNHYFGWGQEDDDMFERIRRIYKKVKHFDKKKGKYHALEHGRVKGLDETDTFKNNSKYLKTLRKQGQKLMEEDGFSSVDKFSKLVKKVEGPVQKDAIKENDMDIIPGVKYKHLLVEVLDANGDAFAPCAEQGKAPT